MLNKLFQNLLVVLSLALLSTFPSCQSNTIDDDKLQVASSGSVSELRTFDPSELEQFEKMLKAEGITIEEDSSYLQTKGILINDLYVRALKVSCKTAHPNGSGTYVDMSGVLLVPKKTAFTKMINHRMIVAMPPTYTLNDEAPSNRFRRVSLVSEDWSLNFFYFFTLQVRAGYAVLIPDYLGFGDSYQQCVHPYIEAKPMISSVIDLIETAKKQLTVEGYRHKEEVILTGYSQGGFMAASVARELELNPSHNIPVNLLIAGGAPCKLKQITDIVRSSDVLVHSYFIPNAIWGYQQNGYSNININDVLLEPYASSLGEVFNGTLNSTEVNEKFPLEVSELYTENFIKNLDTDPNLAYINDILIENSVEPWRNKCRFIMTHAKKDESVYYDNAKDFADQQNSIGGKVTLFPTLGNHVSAAIPYYMKASFYFPFYR